MRQSQQRFYEYTPRLRVLGRWNDREQRSGSLCTKRSVQRCTNPCSRTRVQIGETFEKSRAS